MLADLRRQLDQHQISAVELTHSYLQRIAQTNTELNAYVSVLNDYALEQAKTADDMITAGKAEALTGIPYTLKDVFCVAGIETTACSNILKGYLPPYTATTVQKLQGAVLLGKTNTDEFTMGASTENSAFGPTRNPHDHTRVAGGSSGGPAAAVAADLAAFALGTDTGGSVRQPAAFCGIAGLRVTYGRVSRYGVISMASSMDTIGPLAKTVEDLAIILEQIAGYDVFDGTTPNQPVDSYAKRLDEPMDRAVVGVPKEFFETGGLDPAMRNHIEAVIKMVEQSGVTLKAISLPHAPYAVPTYYVICPAEISSNLARYDGIKYGFRARDAEELFDVYAQSRGQGFGAEAKRRIMIGTYALSAGYYDAFYGKAMKVRTLIRQDFTAAFQDVDFIVAPATPSTAFVVGEKTTDPIQMYLEDVFMAPGSLAGLPGLVVPCGQLNKLPVGIQILGPQWSESKVLQFGRKIEQLSGTK